MRTMITFVKIVVRPVAMKRHGLCNLLERMSALDPEIQQYMRLKVSSSFVPTQILVDLIPCITFVAFLASNTSSIQAVNDTKMIHAPLPSSRSKKRKHLLCACVERNSTL